MDNVRLDRLLGFLLVQLKVHELVYSLDHRLGNELMVIRLGLLLLVRLLDRW